MTAREVNPFEVLRIDPATPTEESVRAAGKLRQLATDELTITTIRRAVQALTGSPHERRLHELFTHPSPCYDWPAIDQFVGEFWRAPAPERPGVQEKV